VTNAYKILVRKPGGKGLLLDLVVDD